jgi:hypothetical protein
MRHDHCPPFKAYREHDSTIDDGWKTTQQGYLVTGQLDSTGSVTSYINPGDETGWVFWATSTRALGTWAQSFLAIVTTSSGAILPVKNQSLISDTRYAAKQLVTTAQTNDQTKVRHLTGSWEDGDFGLVTQGSADETYELVFSPIGGAGVPKIYARVLWNYDLVRGDMSECEILTYTEAYDRWDASGEVGWIDTPRSNSVAFDTAGDATIFEVRSFRADFVRYGQSRTLYLVERVTEDSGYKIDYFRTVDRNFESALFGNLLSLDLSNPVWGDESSIIETTILGTPKRNSVLARIDNEWITLGAEDYAYLERDVRNYSTPFYFRPIRPVLNDNLIGVYRSAETFPSGDSISSYWRAE